MSDSSGTFWEGVWNGLMGGWATHAATTDRQNADVQAFGVNPNTGALIAPQYAKSSAAAGRDPSNPSAFVAQQKAASDAFYQSQYDQNWNDLADQFGILPDLNTLIPGSSDFSKYVLIGIAVLVLFIVVKEVA